MFTALEQSTIKMDDFCTYHFDDDVEETWTGFDKNTWHFIEQRYECERRATGRTPTVCVKKYETRTAWDVKECRQCFVDNTNDRWVASPCRGKDVCDGTTNGRDCDIWPLPAASASSGAASSGAAAAQAANQLETIVGDGSTYRGK